MSVITISRGTFSGGKMLAECLGQRLGYRCIDRDTIVERASTPRVSREELRAALEHPPSILGRFNHKRYVYLALVQAALTEQVRAGRVVYHGLAGHLLLRGVTGILRLRIIAPLEFRIRMAQEELKLGRGEVIAHIEKMDRDRRKWTQYLYGVDWGDPALYDFVINLEHVGIGQACSIAASMIETRTFEFTPECQAALNDLALASRVRAELALSAFTGNLEVQVEAAGGAVTVKGELTDEQEEVRRIAMAVPGVTNLTLVEQAGPADEAWPWTTKAHRT